MTARHISDRWAIPFFTLWIGQTLSLIGSRVAGFAVIWWLTKQTGSAVTLTTLALIATVPQIVLGPIVGALIDRWNRKTILITADSLSALAAAILAYLFWLDSLAVWHIYLLTFVGALGGTFHFSTMMASTSLMVPEKHLGRVQGVNQSLQGVLAIAGPPLGALALAILPLHAIMGVDVVTAIFAIAPLIFIRIPQPTAANHTPETTSVMADVRSGVAYLWQWKGLLLGIIFGIILNLMVNPVLTVLPILITEHFQGGATQLAWTEAAFGAGFLSGGLLLSVWGGFKRKVIALPIGMSGAGLGALIIGLSPSSAIWLAGVGMFIMASSFALINGEFIAMMQAVVAPNMQGRIFTIIGSGLQAAVPLGLIVTGPMVDKLGAAIWFTIAGVVILAFGLVMPFIPAIMNMEESAPNMLSESLNMPEASAIVDA